MNTKTALKYGKTDTGLPYVESGTRLIQKDRHGNWNAFVAGVVKESYRDLADALEFVGVKLETKAQFDAFAKEHTFLWRDLMCGVMRDFA